MAVDKLVDSARLDSDLTSVANAIRAKSGGSSQLAFPAGFVSEIGNISGGYSVSAVFNQGENLVFTTDDLDDLRRFLTVTVTYSDQSSQVLPDDAYTLSGTLTAGYSTITVTALKISTTVSVYVIAAVDVTPNLANVSGANATVAWNAETGELKAYTTAVVQWGQGYMLNYTVDSGYRYRITAKALVADPQTKARISFMKQANASLFAVTNTLRESGDLLYDGIPSNNANYVQNAEINFYVTGSPSSTGSAIFSKVKFIRYADADAAQALGMVLPKGEKA